MHLLQETPAADDKKRPPRQPAPKRDAQADFIGILKKKVAVSEEKLKNLEGELQAQRLELAAAKEREKRLEEAKASSTHDAQSFERLKKEHALLKEEVGNKERLLEEEISRRRLETEQLADANAQMAALQEQLSKTQDVFRKTQTLYERTVADLKEARAELEKQTKAAQEASGQKTQGGWVAREEFDKVEHELREKEMFIKKLLALQQQQQQPPPQEGGKA